MAELQNENIIKTDGTPNTGVTKSAQLLLRRKTDTQWEQFDQTIPFGEPCFSYNPQTGDCTLKVGVQDSNGNLQMWNSINLLRCRVDDGELG